jgi:integrase
MPRKSRGYWLERREPSGIWRVCWTAHRRKNARSTGTRDEGEARQFLARFLAALDRPEQPDQPTVSAILDGYLQDRHGAVVDYARLELCARHLKRHMGWMLADEIRPSHSKSYAIARRKEGVQDGTIAKELRTLRAACRWAAGERWVPAVPRVTPPSSPAPRSRWLTRAEAMALHRSAVSAHIRLFVGLCLATAARSSAIRLLRWEQVDLEARVIDFGAGTANKRRAVVPINDTLHAALAEAKDAAQTEWVIEYNGQRVGSIKKAFARTVKRAGIAHCTPHDLRRTAGSWMLQAGIPIEVVSAMLGHSDIRVTRQVYTHWNVDWLRPAAKALEQG